MKPNLSKFGHLRIVHLEFVLFEAENLVILGASNEWFDYKKSNAFYLEAVGQTLAAQRPVFQYSHIND
jgi:hypothetical protein